METDATQARLHASVSGRVQGVFYRRFVVEEARPLGLSGMVRNLADRRVEVIAEGPKPGLAQLLRRLRQGPPDAEVTGVEVEWEPVRSEYAGFGIE